MRISKDWKEYELLDVGNGEKVERWGKVILRRPDPQAIWPAEQTNLWEKIDACYFRSDKGGGRWEFYQKVPEYWTISYKELTFKVSPTGFKHTGLFPEQACNWDYIIQKIKYSQRQVRVLNLFAYTGGATLASAFGGAFEVVHVDASKGMIEWAKENVTLSHLDQARIRFIVDDCLKFVEREARRGRKYDAIIMDPPSYGRGPNGEMWKFEHQIQILIEACRKILSDQPLFFLVNSYTTGISATGLSNILTKTILKDYPNGTVEAGEIGLPIKQSDLILPCGIYARYESN